MAGRCASGAGGDAKCFTPSCSKKPTGNDALDAKRRPTGYRPKSRGTVSCSHPHIWWMMQIPPSAAAFVSIECASFANSSSFMRNRPSSTPRTAPASLMLRRCLHYGNIPRALRLRPVGVQHANGMRRHHSLVPLCLVLKRPQSAFTAPVSEHVKNSGIRFGRKTDHPFEHDRRRRRRAAIGPSPVLSKHKDRLITA